MYTLILTLIVARAGANIQHIDFTTQASCERAKIAWLQQFKGTNDWAVLPSAICVEHD